MRVGSAPSIGDLSQALSAPYHTNLYRCISGSASPARACSAIATASRHTGGCSEFLAAAMGHGQISAAEEDVQAHFRSFVRVHSQKHRKPDSESLARSRLRVLRIDRPELSNGRRSWRQLTTHAGVARTAVRPKPRLHENICGMLPWCSPIA